MATLNTQEQQKPETVLSLIDCQDKLDRAEALLHTLRRSAVAEGGDSGDGFLILHIIEEIRTVNTSLREVWPPA